MTRKPRIHELLNSPQSGHDIEALSFATIDREAPPHRFSPAQWEIVRRMIHTTADFSIMEWVRFSNDAITAGIDALREGRPLFVDSNMIRAGLSLSRLQRACEHYERNSIHCHVADSDVAEAASREGLPRSILAVRKAGTLLDGAIAVFGNAPTALLELNRMIIEEGLRPALVIAAPVGFVHVRESKQELMELEVPHIALADRRGGSPIAVSMIHALCTLAAGQPQHISPVGPSGNDFDAVILLGHGSRVPDAGQSMQKVAETLCEHGRYTVVETCHMSRLGPHFEETLNKCVHAGARNVVVLPYFLNQGLHMKLDIPEMMQQAAERYPRVKLTFGKNLGYDPLIVQLVEKRIEESRDLDDVRQAVLPSEADYPIPPGQCEFVPMLPQEAASWKQAHQDEK